MNSLVPFLLPSLFGLLAKVLALLLSSSKEGFTPRAIHTPGSHCGSAY